MCGRLSVALPATDLARAFPEADDADALDLPRYNVAPTQRVPAVVAGDARVVAHAEVGEGADDQVPHVQRPVRDGRRQAGIPGATVSAPHRSMSSSGKIE